MSRLNTLLWTAGKVSVLSLALWGGAAHAALPIPLLRDILGLTA